MAEGCEQRLLASRTNGLRALDVRTVKAVLQVAPPVRRGRAWVGLQAVVAKPRTMSWSVAADGARALRRRIDPIEHGDHVSRDVNGSWQGALADGGRESGQRVVVEGQCRLRHGAWALASEIQRKPTFRRDTHGRNRRAGQHSSQDLAF